MSVSLLPRLLRAGGLVTVAAALLGCAGRADAACGDHVKILNPVGTANPPAGPGDAPAKVPCHGSICTGGPKVPAPVPPTPSGPTVTLKAVVPAGDAGSDPSFVGRLTPTTAGAPVRHPSAILHPPRLG